MDQLLTPEYGLVGVVIYLIFRELVPKIAPILSKRISTEDRLFKLLETNSEVLLKLNFSLVQLADTLKEIDHRIEAIESNMLDNSSALKIAARLIKD